ncbi:carboxypeptidase-like regulatory domain-containing protein [Mucilaginibacter sp.]|uniref:carboxypeptidase-like regulatory domain-containing protein n=1 Tax=Mucilaginibacter sp. TaxID=1882438 RepID=UPI0035652AA0
MNKNFAVEKIHMQFDKPYYALGDTIWFKAWLINAPSFLLSAKSGLLHIEIATDSNKVIQQFLLPISNGVTWGNIAINDKDYKAGAYVIRAYTNWMRNFGDETFYCKRINITTAYEDAWLVNSKMKQSVINTKPNVQAVLQFKNLDQSPVVGKPVSLRVMSGKKTLYKQVLDTDLFGSMDISFAPPQKTGGLYIVAESDTKDKRAIIPLNINNPENTDLQFMPEGGSLVAGLPARIGFKAIGEDGRGADLKGIITDSKGVQVATFQSAHKGMGSFTMDVKAAESYSAKVTLPGGVVKAYPLPVVASSGIVLQVSNSIESDSVKLALAATADILQKRSAYYLIAKARGVICYAAILNFQDHKTIQRVITKNLFPTGITHFILMTDQGVPLNERLVYIDQKDNLNISFKTGSGQTAPKDSIALHLTATDNTGKPVTGNFAISVTDDALVNTDTLQSDNIFTNLLLTSDLKGYVEEPAYYFQRNAIAWQELDNLLLTQGWVNYEMPTKGPAYAAETDYSVTGRVTNVFNKPVSKSKVVFFSSRPLVVKDTVTDKHGRFVFNPLPIVDTPMFIIKAVNKSGKSMNVGVEINEFIAPKFTATAIPSAMPWYVNSNDTLTNYVKNNISLKREKEKMPAGIRLLKQVNITAKKIVKGSNNLNGPGNADLVFDEKDLEKAGKKTMLQFLEENVKGFRERSYLFPKNLPQSVAERVYAFEVRLTGNITGIRDNWFFIGQKAAVLKVDGIEFRDFNPEFGHDYIRNFLQSHSAEEIKGIEVNATSQYSSNYMRRWRDMPMEEPDYHEYAFIEITTRSGHGPALSTTPGVYLYKPLPLSLPKQFYKPRYNVTDIATPTENRSTVNWEPNIITNAAGHATIKFNAATKPSTYTIIAQGVDYNGNIGYHYQKLVISKTSVSNK